MMEAVFERGNRVIPDFVLTFTRPSFTESGHDEQKTLPSDLYRSNLDSCARQMRTRHTFADGSARYVPWSRTVTPINLWATTDAWRYQNVTTSGGISGE